MTQGAPPRARRAERVGLAAAVTLAVLAALAAALAAGGPFGLVVAAECLAALALVIALGRTPGAVRGRRMPRAGARARLTWDRLRRRRGHSTAVRVADFPAYVKISSDLSWAPISLWHYDHGIRPLISRLLESALAERHRVDLTADPERARALVGEDIWPLVDPARPPSFDSKAPGMDRRTLTRIVDRLERL